jgi:hypothetical protein
MPEPRLLDRFHAAARLRRLSPRTESTYKTHIKQFVVWGGMRHPLDLGEEHVRDVLSWLAAERGVSAVTQNSALCALIFLDKHALGRPLGPPRSGSNGARHGHGGTRSATGRVFSL